MKGDKPLLIVMGHVEWDKMSITIENDVGEILNPFSNFEFDFMAFDHMYKVSISIVVLYMF